MFIKSRGRETCSPLSSHIPHKYNISSLLLFFPWEMFRRAPVFSSTNSGFTSRTHHATATKSNHPHFLWNSNLRRNVRTNNFSPRTDTLRKRLICGYFLLSQGTIYSFYPQNLNFLMHPLLYHTQHSSLTF